MGFDMNPADEDPHGECRHEIEQLRNAVQNVICCPCVTKLCEHCVGSLQAVRGKSVDPNKYVLVERASLTKLEDALRVAYRDITGDYSDGGQWMDKRTVITRLIEVMKKAT